MNDKRNAWLVKFAPFRTPWSEVIQRGNFPPRGIRSPLARRHLAAMRLGDLVLYYHSQIELAVVGVMEVSREAYPDPTSTDPQWLTCDFKPLRTLPRPVTLAEIKFDPRFASLALLNQPRLTVMPISGVQFQIITKERSHSTPCPHLPKPMPEPAPEPPPFSKTSSTPA